MLRVSDLDGTIHCSMLFSTSKLPTTPEVPRPCQPMGRDMSGSLQSHKPGYRRDLRLQFRGESVQWLDMKRERPPEQLVDESAKPRQATCPKCKSVEVEARTKGHCQTLVGFLTREKGHNHDNNCWTRDYRCLMCKHRWRHALRRRCPAPDCDWVTKEECFCFEGKALDAFPEPKHPIK